MASPAFDRTLSAVTYLGQPIVYGQVRFDYFNWGSRSIVLDGTDVPPVGKEVALEGKDESGGANKNGWVFQMRTICPAAGRPSHPVFIQLVTKSAGAQSLN